MPYTIEPARPGGESALKHLWKTVFGDPDAFIDAFFETLYQPDRTITAKEGGAVISAMYLLDCGSLPAPVGSCGYLYALATDPAHRGQGAGGAVVLALARLAADLGYGNSLLSPASADLVPYYTGLGFRPLSYLETTEVVRAANIPDQMDIKRIHAPVYAALRRPWIAGTGMDYPIAYLSFLERTLNMSGGGLFSVRCGDDPGCAAVTMPGNGAVHVKELLIPENQRDSALAAIARQFDTRTVLLSASCHGGVWPHTMIYDPSGQFACPFDPRIPFVLD